MKRFHGRRVFVDSIGVRQRKLDSFMVEVMTEIGVNMSNHKPKVFDNLTDDSFNVVASLSPKAQHKAVDLTRYMHCDVKRWTMFDPSLAEGSRESRLAAYRQVLDQLQQRILDVFPKSEDEY